MQYEPPHINIPGLEFQAATGLRCSFGAPCTDSLATESREEAVIPPLGGGGAEEKWMRREEESKAIQGPFPEAAEALLCFANA